MCDSETQYSIVIVQVPYIALGVMIRWIGATEREADYKGNKITNTIAFLINAHLQEPRHINAGTGANSVDV